MQKYFLDTEDHERFNIISKLKIHLKKNVMVGKHVLLENTQTVLTDFF